MAFSRRPDIGEAFKSDPQLQQFLLSDVTPTGRILGTGSYGSVEEMSYKHLICAGKRLHEALIDVENEGVAEVIRKYLQECQLMSSLRHPNITQFLGLCFLPGTQLPLLVMERLETSLDDLLEHMPNIPLSFKRSILEDIASGLLYLHDRQPPVIHRDLTSKNVLLTSSLVAKITDMGNSRIVAMRPGQLARTLTKYPGTLVYMPPEAQDDIHRYGAAMDIFAFGHLALYTLTEVFPGDLLPSTYLNPDKSREVKGRTEIERRRKYIDVLKAQFTTRHSGLVELVMQCLQNDPRERPSTEHLLTRLQGMRGQVEGEYGGSAIKLDLVIIKMSKELKEKEKRLSEPTRHQEEMKASVKEMEEMKASVEEITQRLKGKDEHIQRLQAEIRAKDEQIATMNPKKDKTRNMEQPQTLQASQANPDKNKWETDRQSVKLIKKVAIGEYTQVFEGIWKCRVPVIVKTLKLNSSLPQAQFLKEAERMKHFSHPNIIQLLAVCTQSEPAYIVTEMIKLDLLDHLRANGQDLKLPQLISMSLQIAGAMAYMESINCIHRYLMARSIRTTNSGICKISSFRCVTATNEGIYESQSFDARSALKWTAPEAIVFNKFSIKCDVWSFGIVLHEIVTNGQSPYKWVANSEVLSLILEGYRMHKPENCPDKLYEMMMNCWEKKPENRPSFQTLETQLKDLFTLICTT